MRSLRLVGVPDVAKMLGVSPQYVYRLARRPDWPTPVGTLGRQSIWNATDIEAWQAKHRPPSPQ